MPRLALFSVFLGLLAILATVVLVLGDANLTGRVPPLLTAGLAGLGGLLLVLGLWRIEPAAPRGQTFSG
jgi:hypothetical protein